MLESPAKRLTSTDSTSRTLRTSRLTPEHAYLVEVDGDPQVRLRMELWPDQELGTLTRDDIHAIGMRITGLPIVNAIPAVCAAPAGIRTYADLPTISGAAARR